MRSFDRLPSQLIRLLVAAAILAAVFILVLPAAADDGCPPGGCPLPPPQSREVNPAPARADGSAVEVQRPGDLLPVEMTVRVLAPTFIEPAPIGASFETITVPVRYQAPGDVSCGVQALGMALDALPGAAPTSSALLGLLQDNGMMYDFGTGVEELAYAAQSFGYKGSHAFHDASLDDLKAQLSTGNPVVVSLGSNGENTPGHFVTVTGVSPDGELVAYNDPTLGEQVVSASEFSRLWGLQGNSGVVVAPEPPPDTPDLTPWVALAAGLMALVSTTPLGALRSGVGGRLDAGVTGGGRGSPAPRSEPRSDPPDKDKEDKKPKKTKGRFDEEIVVAPPKPPKVKKARFDEEPPPPPTPKPTPKPHFDAEPLSPASSTPRPTAAPIVTPSEQRAARATATPDSSRRDEERQVAYSPSAATQGTPRASQTAVAVALRSPVNPMGLPPLPEKYLKYIPTPTAYERNERTPIIPLGMLEVGVQDVFHAGVPASDSLRLTPTKWAFSLGSASVKVGWGGSTIELGVRTPRKEYTVESTSATMAVGQSGSFSVTWDGWNTITKAAYNAVDYTVSGPDDREIVYGSGVNGVYVEEKPIQVAVLSEVAVAVIGAALFAPEVVVGLWQGLGKNLSPLPEIP